MGEQFSMCSHYDVLGSLKENLTLKKGVLLKSACWPLQSPGLAKAMSEMTSNVKIYFVMDPWFGMLDMCVG